MEQIRFYDDIPEKGMIIDWGKVMKEFRKLKIPSDVYNPTKLPITKAKYFNLLSARSTGKTTNILLLGMVCHKLYGTIIQYIRKTEAMLYNQVIGELFKTIKKYDYVTKLTEGRWNSVYYYSRKWYYCNIDADGKIYEKDSEHFMYCLAVNRRDDYKSTYNAPTGDFIIYDEYISERYTLNEFVHVEDLIKTIIRDRITPVIFFLANTIDKHSEYFAEMEIYEDVQTMELGQHEIITSSRGTKVYVELIQDAKEANRKKELNSLFFGFGNPMLSSITGDGWAISSFPHIESGYTTLMHGVYIDYHGRLLELEFVEYPEGMGMYINVHRASQTYPDSVIYCNEERKDYRYRFHMGTGSRLDKLIDWCIINHRIRFHDNSCGTIFFNHCNHH